jgi:hypothetical protein
MSGGGRHTVNPNVLVQTSLSLYAAENFAAANGHQQLGYTAKQNAVRIRSGTTPCLAAPV